MTDRMNEWDERIRRMLDLYRSTTHPPTYPPTFRFLLQGGDEHAPEEEEGQAAVRQHAEEGLEGERKRKRGRGRGREGVR